MQPSKKLHVTDRSQVTVYVNTIIWRDRHIRGVDANGTYTVNFRVNLRFNITVAVSRKSCTTLCIYGRIKTKLCHSTIIIAS